VERTYASPHSETQPERGLRVYLPSGYSEAVRGLPVLYLLHGAGGRAHSWVVDGRVAEIMDRLIGAGRIRPAIVVMPHGDFIHPPSQANTGENAERLMRDLTEVLMPLIERDYGVSTRREDTAVAGLSKGARQAAYLLLRMPERFDAAGCFSIGRFPPLDPEGDEGRLAGAIRESGLTFRTILVGWGVNEPVYRDTGRRFAAMLGHSATVLVESPAGGHEWTVWRDLLENHFLPAWLGIRSGLDPKEATVVSGN
jgi:enterochelin esterase-like enzyme